MKRLAKVLACVAVLAAGNAQAAVFMLAERGADFILGSESAG